MRYALLIIALLMPLPASAQFLSGMADGVEDARRLEQERRAMEHDRRFGTNTYDAIANRNRMSAIERQLKANAELLERLDRERFDRLYGPHPRY